MRIAQSALVRFHGKLLSFPLLLPRPSITKDLRVRVKPAVSARFTSRALRQQLSCRPHPFRTRAGHYHAPAILVNRFFRLFQPTHFASSDLNDIYRFPAGSHPLGIQVQKKAWRLPTFPPLREAVSSAWEGLTSVFGMGTGVTPPP